MPKWYDITRSEDYQALPPEDRAEMKQRFFQKRILPGLQADEELNNKEAIQFAFENFMQQPDDTGQNIVSSTLGSAARGFGEMFPGAIEGAGALTGIEEIRGAGQAVRGGLEYITPTNPIYAEGIPAKIAGVGGQVGSIFATAGVGGLASKTLAGAKIAAGATAAEQAALASQAIGRGAKAASYLSSGLQGAAGGANEAERYGLEGLEAYLRTLAGAATAIGSEALPFGALAETAAARRVLGETVQGAPGIRRAFANEALEGASEQIGGNIATQALAPLGTETPGVLEGVGEAALLEGVGGAMFGAVNRLTAPRTPTVATPPPVQPASDVAANVAATDEGEVAPIATPDVGTPVTLDGVNYTVSIPPGSSLSPDALAGFYDDPETLQALHERGDIRLEQVIAPTETVDTTPLNNNVAASAAFVPQVTKAMTEIADAEALSEGAERNRAVVAEAAAKLRSKSPNGVSAGLRAAIPQPAVTPAASMPMMVTRDMRQQLSDLGYSKTEVSAMRPEEAAAVIASGVSKRPTSQPAVTPAQETPVAPAESDGGSLGQMTPAAGGSSPDVTAAMVPQEPVVSSAEIAPAGDPFAAVEEPVVEPPVTPKAARRKTESRRAPRTIEDAEAAIAEQSAAAEFVSELRAEGQEARVRQKKAAFITESAEGRREPAFLQQLLSGGWDKALDDVQRGLVTPERAEKLAKDAEASGLLDTFTANRFSRQPAAAQPAAAQPAAAQPVKPKRPKKAPAPPAAEVQQPPATNVPDTTTRRVTPSPASQVARPEQPRKAEGGEQLAPGAGAGGSGESRARGGAGRAVADSRSNVGDTPKPLRPKFVAGETVTFKEVGQQVMGTVDEVNGDLVTITYNWNGKKDMKRVLRANEIQREAAGQISEPQAVAPVADASTITDADIDRSLSDEDKRVATAELGGKSWEDSREAFKKSFANFLNGAASASKKLVQIFKKLASAMKSIALTSAFFFTSGNSSYVQSFSVREVAEVSKPRASFAPSLPRPETGLPRELPPIGAEILSTPDARAGVGRMPAPVIGVAALRPKANFGGQQASRAVRELADFVVGTSNNKGYAFVVADKKGGLMYAFDGTGKLVKKMPALFGKDIGDFADLSSDMETGGRVTPSGRFFANPSADPEYGFTLDFVEGDAWNIAIHKLYLGDPSEQRMSRIGSQTPLDNRISYGCINLDETAMAEVIEPLFVENGGFVYVLPETQKGAKEFNQQIGEQMFPLRPTFKKGETVAFKENGQQVMGTVAEVDGDSVAVVYNWNGKSEQRVIKNRSQVQRPVLAVAEEPNYKYTQEQNARKAARFGLPTEPGVTVGAGSVIKNALARIASDTAMPQMLRAVARALQNQNYDGVDLRIEADGRRWYAGYYLNDNGITEIGINLRLVGRGQVDAVSVLLHEALHHVTLAKVRDPQGEIETQAVEALDTLRKRIKVYAGLQQKATKFSYELGTVDEFITALFTRPDFQDFIAGIPDTFTPGTPGSKFRSALSEVFRIIAQLVTGQKVQKGGILDQSFASTLALFETPQRAARGQSVDYTPAATDVARHAELEAKHNAGTITPEETAEAQRMVDEAAKAAGYNVGPVPHGTTAGPFNEFRVPAYFGSGASMYAQADSEIVSWKGPRTSVKGIQASQIEDGLDSVTGPQGFDFDDLYAGKANGRFVSFGGDGIYRFDGVDEEGDLEYTLVENLTPVRDESFNIVGVEEAPPPSEFPRIIRAYLRMTNPATLGARDGSRLAKGPNGSWDQGLYDQLVSAGHDGVIADDDWGGPWNKHYIVFSPEQIKSADPFTGVPLDERFQPTSPDIRFSATDDAATAEPVFTPDEARAILTKRFGKAVADKFNIEVMAPRRMGNREVEVDAELRGGTISLNLKFMDSEELLIQKAEHEMAHAVFSDKGVQDAWRELSASMPPDVRQRITERMKQAGYDPRVLDEEVLVRFLEEVRANTSPSKWKAFMDAVIDAFRRLFGAMPDERTARLAAARIIAAGEAAVARGLDPGKQAFGQSVSPVGRMGWDDAIQMMRSLQHGQASWTQETTGRFTEEEELQTESIMGEFLGGKPMVSWPRVKAARLIRIWNDFAKTGFVRDERGIDSISEQVRKLIVRLHVANAMSGHDTYYPQETWELSEEDNEKLQDFLVNEKGEWYVSDYGLPYLYPLYQQLLKAETAEQKLQAVDRVLNVVHQRSDLASMFVEGGSETLGKVGGFGEERMSVNEPRVATQRNTVISEKYPGTINLEAAISYAEQVKMAQDAIAKYKKASESKDKIQVLADAREAILLDRDIRTSTKMVAFDLLAQQGSILANLAQAESRSQIALDDFANLTATATGVLESDPAGFADYKFTTTDDLAKMASEAGRTLSILKAIARLTPEGFLRSQERIRTRKVNEATEQQFGATNVMSEIEKLWRMMQEAGATDRGLAIAAALKAFMPSRKNAAALIDKLFPQAGIRDRMTKGGEALVRDFFQMMAGPRDPKGPLAEFDESIQSALSSMLRKVMEARGLVADNQTVQATDIDKLVRSVSADPLRFDKIAAADAAMQDELAKIEDDERRATLQQAWEEATSKMYTNVANDATLRRAVNAELKGEGVKWNEMFDKGQKPAAIRAKVVDAVMTKVGALITGQTDPTAEIAELEKRLQAETDAQKQKQLREQIVDVRAQANALKNNLASLRSEVGAAFDFIAETKRVQWLAYRAGVEARRRVAERRKDMLAALRNRGVAESALMRLNEKMAGPQRPGAEPNPVSTLIGEHIKTPVEGFIDKLVALGVDQPTAEALDAISGKTRADLAKLAEANSIDSAIRRLAEKLAGPPRPGRPPNAVADLVNKQVREPAADFAEKLAALGATQTDIDLLVSLTDKVRVDSLERKLFNSLKPKTKAAKSAIPRLLRVLLEAGKTGAFDSKAFNDALGEAFDFPPMTAEQEAEIKRMVTEINKLPQGAARVDKQQELQNYVALVQGVPARDMLLSAWYANVLSGISTQLIGLVGNSMNTALRSAFLAVTSPNDFKSYLRGALGVGADAGLAEVKAAMKGRGAFKVGRLDSPEIANALEVLFRKGPTTPAEWVAYVASGATRLRMVFRIMGAIDAFFWNSAREGMYHLAASRTVRKMAKEAGMTEEESNAEFIRQLGGGPEAYEAALKDAEAALTKAGQPADMATMDRMARESIDKARAEINPEAVQAANRWADRMVLQQEPEGVGKIISALIKAVQSINVAGFPLGQMLVPFNKIVSNLFEQSLDYTGLGLVRAALGMHISDARIDWSREGVPGIAPADKAKVFDKVERRERAMAGFVGLTLSAAAYVAAKANMDDDDDEVPFMLYAFGPTDKNKREQMPDGWVPFSIKIGDTYYRYAEWPLGMVLAGFGAALDAERYGNMKEKDTLDRIGYSAMLGLKGFMTQGVLSSVDTAIDVLMFKATGKKYTDIPVNAAKGLIPAQGFLRDMSGLFDNTKVSNDDVASALMKDIPVVKSWGTKPELNVFGEPTLTEGEAVLRRFLTQRRPHAEADYLTRNKLYIPGMDETVTIGQYLPPTERDRFKRRAMQMDAMENGVFTAEQNYNFRKRAGELTKSAVQRVMKQAPAVKTEQQRKAVQNLIDKQVGLARRRAMVEAVPYEAPR